MTQTKTDKIGSAKIIRALSFWRNVTRATLKEMPVDLSARQTAVMLTVYLVPPPHSVKGLSDSLKISKPAICRAIDALEKGRLVKRARDRHDNRNVLIGRTAKGAAYLNELADIILDVERRGLGAVVPHLLRHLHPAGDRAIKCGATIFIALNLSAHPHFNFSEAILHHPA